MLGKLIKHEFKATALPMLIMSAVLAAMPIVEGILVAFADVETEAGVIVFFIALFNFFTQLLAFSAALTVAYVLAAIRFYTHIYGNQGYLTLMLPAKRSELLFSKLFCSSAWLILLSIIGYIGIIVPILFLDFGGITIYSAFSIAFAEIDYPFGLYFALVSVTALISLISMISTLYCSVSLGQLFRKNRVLAAILIYFGIYSVQYTVNMVVAFITSFTYVVTIPEKYLAEASGSMNMSWISVGVSALISVVFFAVQYLLTGHILKKRVNLQ